MNKVLVVAFDVTGLTDAEIANLANAATVQGEGSDDTDAGAYPAVGPIADRTYEFRLIHAEDHVTEVLDAVEVGLSS